jgi:hypothetical protein
MEQDLKSAVNNFIDLHAGMQASSASATTPSRQALINKQLLKLEVMMTELWIVAAKYIANFDIVQPKVFNQLVDRSNISLLCNNTDDLFDGDDIDLNEIVYEENAPIDTNCTEDDDNDNF